jgi:tetratricopeptide (TPR) repeat protein
MEALVRTVVHARFGILVLALLSLAQAVGVCADSFSSGEDFFLSNQPEKAIPLLEAAIRENPEKAMAFYHLGTAYAQVKRLDDAIAVFKKGAKKFIDKDYEFFYNIGNCYFMMNKSAFAKEWYDQAIASRSDYGLAYLSRAQAFLNLRDTFSAVNDYRQYLVLDPNTSQRVNIEKLIAMIEKKMADAELLKAQEAARLAAEEARRQQMLADVAASLKEAAADTESLSAGTDNAEGYSDESELAD